eukprot:3299600-Alexandrium_andersonii.AAC.1
MATGSSSGASSASMRCPSSPLPSGSTRSAVRTPASAKCASASPSGRSRAESSRWPGAELSTRTPGHARSTNFCRTSSGEPSTTSWSSSPSSSACGS